MFCLYRIGVLFFALIFCKLFGAKKIVRKKGEEIWFYVFSNSLLYDDYGRGFIFVKWSLLLSLL